MHKDKFTLKAKKEGMRARSAYKLQEINNRFKIIRQNDAILDLGCWPGGWMIVASRIAKNGYVLGVDKVRIDAIEGCEFILGDVMQDNTFNKIKSKIDKVDVVLSDLAPKTTGIKELDIENSKKLALKALFIAKKMLKNNGHFLFKLFQGGNEAALTKKIRDSFSIVKIYKPATSKKRSKEIYIIAKGFKD